MRPASYPTVLRPPCAPWLAVLLALLALLAATAPLSALVLTTMPIGASRGVDLDGDGAFDFTFFSSTLSTMDYPSSGSSTLFSIQGVGGSRVLANWNPTLSKEYPKVLGWAEGATVPRVENLSEGQGYRDRVSGLASINRNIYQPNPHLRLGSTDLTELFLPIVLATADGDRYGYLHFRIVPSWPVAFLNEAGEVAHTMDTPALLLLGWKLAEAAGESLAIVPIPEPTTLALLTLGSLATALTARRRN